MLLGFICSSAALADLGKVGVLIPSSGILPIDRTPVDFACELDIQKLKKYFTPLAWQNGGFDKRRVEMQWLF
eukprot:m.170185 g.170185  ORF g.170185 m.170185 type:complete len:72 (+) comp39032_c0_seq2:521-736(+)